MAPNSRVRRSMRLSNSGPLLVAAAVGARGPYLCNRRNLWMPLNPARALKSRRANPSVGARPAFLQVGVDVRIGLTLSLQRLLQSEQRPAVMRVVLDVVAIHLFGIRKSFGGKQRRAKPMSSGEGQRLRLVVFHLVVQLHRLLEFFNRGIGLARRQRDLAFEDTSQHADNSLRGVRAELRLRCLGYLLDFREVRFREFRLAELQLRIAHREIKRRGGELAFGALGQLDDLVEAAEANQRQR